MSDEAKQPPFKKGDMACLILRVTEFQPSLSTEEDDSRVIFDCTDIEGISTEYSFRHDVIFAATRHLRPVPSENEYSLTLRELADFADWYANSQFMSQVSPALYEQRFGDASTSDMVRLWLKNRGKEVKP